MSPAAPLLLAMLVTGLAGSLGHCLGMCGPLVLLVGARFPHRGLAAAPDHLLYHGGRIGVYALLGLAAGGLGALAQGVFRQAYAPALISLVLGVLVIVAGLLYLGWLRAPLAQRLGGWWQAVVKRGLRLPGSSGIVLLGALNGLLPCGLVYSAMLLAAATGSAWGGVLGMVIFGLGTLPALMLFGVGAGVASVPLRRALAKISGLFVILVGVQLLLRGAAGLGLVAHLMLPGKVMFW